MSKLPVALFATTVLLIAGVTIYERQAQPVAAEPVAAAKKQIELASSKPEYLPEVRAVAPSPALEKYLRSPELAHKGLPAETASVPVSAAVLEQALAAEKATNQTLVQSANVIANAPSSGPGAAPSPFTPKFIMQCLLTLIFCPAALYFIISSRFTAGDKNFAYTTIGTILGFWFATGV